MKKLFIYFCFFYNALNAQNLMPNSSFEIAQPGKTPQCASHYSGLGINCPSEDFDEDIADWKRALMNPNCLCLLQECASPDWVDYTTCNPPYGGYPHFSDRFVVMGHSSDPSMREGVRAGFINSYKLKANTAYTLRVRLAGISLENTIRFYATKFGENWNSDGGDNVKLSNSDMIIYFNVPSGEMGRWVQIQRQFTVPNDMGDVLGTLAFSMEKGAVYIDDVELFEGGCTDDLLIENRTYNLYEIPYYAENIKAGYDVGAPTTNGNVTIQNTANVTYKAVQSVELLPGFIVEQGATFDAFIEPCPPPIVCLPLTIDVQPNFFTPPNPPNEELCFTVTEASEYNIIIQNSSGVTVYSNTGNVSGTTACVWDGHCNTGLGCNGQLMIDGTYYMVGSFSNCLYTVPFSGFFSLAVDQNGKRDNESEKDSENHFQNDSTSNSITKIATSIYPNPNKGKFNIEINEPKIQTKNYEVKIYNLLGDIIYMDNLTSSKAEFDLSYQPKGIYFVKFFSSEGEVLKVERLVVQ